ncbi:hypothetical protein O3P69_012021 [Scylla paramamosain]|uniref:Uncharacterized protein n=1 Tax=Scylla paramamosain TaxID=85552 RepID=A0AAW0SEE0_SCYPA
MYGDGRVGLYVVETEVEGRGTLNGWMTTIRAAIPPHSWPPYPRSSSHVPLVQRPSSVCMLKRHGKMNTRVSVKYCAP